MGLAEITAIVRELGFPVAVAGFVLWRMDRSIGHLTTTIHALHVLIVERMLPWDGCERRRRRGGATPDPEDHR